MPFTAPTILHYTHLTALFPTSPFPIFLQNSVETAQNPRRLLRARPCNGKWTRRTIARAFPFVSVNNIEKCVWRVVNCSCNGVFLLVFCAFLASGTRRARMGAIYEDECSLSSNYSFACSQDLRFSKQVHDNVHGNIYLDQVTYISRTRTVCVSSIGATFPCAQNC